MKLRDTVASFWLWLAPVGLMGCATASAQTSHAQDPSLKNWALSRCLAKANQGERGGDDAAKSAAAYLEMSTVSIQAYERIDSLVDAYLKQTHTGSVKSDYNTMKCIALYQSGDLEAAINQEGRRK